MKGFVLNDYRAVWRKLARYASNQGVEYFELSFAHDFIKSEYGFGIELLTSPYENRRACTVYRAVRYLSEYQMFGMIPSKRKREDYIWSPSLKESFCAYLEWRKSHIHAKTFSNEEYALKDFADYLVQSKINALDEINAECIHGYLRTMQKYTHKVLNYKLTRIRAFLVFSYTNDYCKSSLSELIPRLSYVTPTSIPTTYTKEEIECLLSAVDRANPLGKRDYAILLMCIRLGIRSGDIANLKTDNIDWERKEIKFTQSKTKNPAVLPLLEDVGWAIIDYIRYSRPKIENPYLFLTAAPPFKEFKNGKSVGAILDRQMEKAGISKKAGFSSGMHSLRHALARKMLENGTPLTSVSAAMCHERTNSATTYLRVDIDGLRDCTLSLPGVSTL
jgi:site-specific recombinase XerD